jgi:protein-tyrosine-phosphatase
MTSRPSAILFACTSNAVRSPMAEALMKSLIEFAAYVDSIGVLAAERNEFAVAAMKEIGINLSTHKPKTFDDLEDGSADLIITLSPEAHERALEVTRHSATEVEFWDIPDPMLVGGNRDSRMEAFRDVRRLRTERIKARFPDLISKRA